MGDDSGTDERESVGDAERVELMTDESAGVVFLETELGVLVEFPSDGNQPVFVLLG